MAERIDGLMSGAFEHVPHLRDRLQSPRTSRFRNLDLAELDRKGEEAGYPKGWRRSDADREATCDQFLRTRGSGDLWVFAYGSLMWDPALYFDEVRMAKSMGFSRRFCLVSKIGRGSPAKPGLMAALDEGGQCEGLAFRINAAAVEGEMRLLWRREMLSFGYTPKMVPLKTAQGDIRALAFVIDRESGRYVADQTPDEAAYQISTGEGFLGKNLEYLDRLVAQLSHLGLEDAEMYALHARAQKIAAVK